MSQRSCQIVINIDLLIILTSIQMQKQFVFEQDVLSSPIKRDSYSVKPSLKKDETQTQMKQLERYFRIRPEGYTVIQTGQFHSWGPGDHIAQLNQAKNILPLKRLDSIHNNRVNSSLYGSRLKASKSNSNEEYQFHKDQSMRQRAEHFEQLRSRGEDKKSHLNTREQQESVDKQKIGGKIYGVVFKKDFKKDVDSDEYDSQEENRDKVIPLPIHKPSQGQKLPIPSKPRSDDVKSVVRRLDQKQILDEKFDEIKLERMYKFPASYREAMIHTMASKFGYTNFVIKKDQKEDRRLVPQQKRHEKKIPSKNRGKNVQQQSSDDEDHENEKVPICPCCQNHVSNLEIPVTYPTEPQEVVENKHKFLLQTGVSMYFMFVKAVILYLCLRFAVFDIANMVLSINGHYCSSVQHSNDTCAFTNVSAYNLNTLQDTNSLNILDYLNLGLTLVSIVYFYFYKKKQAQLLNWLDRNKVTQKNFSILVEDIPLFIYQGSTKIDEVKYNHKEILEKIFETQIQSWLDNQVFPKITPQTYQDDKSLHFGHSSAQHYYKFVFKRKALQQFIEKTKKENLKNHNSTLQIKPQKIYSEDFLDKIKRRVRRRKSVASVTVCYDLKELQTLNEIRDGLIEEFIKQRENSVIESKDINFKSLLVKNLPTQIVLINKQYIEQCKKMINNNFDAFQTSHFTGKAIVSFQYKHYRDHLLHVYNSGQKDIKMSEKTLKLSSINSPEDIYWYNMKITDKERRTYIFYTSAVLFMMLVLSFAALVALQYWQRHTQQPTNIENVWDKILSNLFSVAMAVLTNVINILLSYAIQLLAVMEKHKTKSDRLNSLMIKIIVTQTINTAFIYFILSLISPSNPLGKTGLVKNVFNLVLVSGFINVFWELIAPIYSLKKLYYFFKYVGKENINMFQVQLNQLLQQPEFRFADSYANYIVFTFVVSFYGMIAPAATPVLILIFIAQYWVDKYNLFNRYSCPVNFGSQLIKKTFIMFESSLVIFALGHFVWDLKMHTDQSTQFRVLNITNLVIASLFVTFQLFAPYKWKRYIFPFEDEQCDPYSYSSYQKTNSFRKTYYRQNPATSCMKQTRNKRSKKPKLKQGNQEVQELQEYVVYEAPDPQFIQPENDFIKKYMGLDQQRKLVQGYTKMDVIYFNNRNNTQSSKTEIQKEFQKFYSEPSNKENNGLKFTTLGVQENVKQIVKMARQSSK